MKRITLLNGVENLLNESLNIVCIESNECVCTDETASTLADWCDVIIEDMTDEEFENLPSYIKEQFG